MISEVLTILTLTSIWISLLMGLLTLSGAVSFWLPKSRQKITVGSLPYYPLITLVVPAHNEELVIKQTISAILNLNYPHNKLEILLYADNCTDETAEMMRKTVLEESVHDQKIRVVERSGNGGKAGVLNDALKIATGKYIGVYDADAVPEKNALYFLVKKILEKPNRYKAAFGRNKTRNAQHNFLTKCINQEIVVTQRIQHVGIWQLFRIGRIPGTNFIIETDYVKKIGGWTNGALTEDTDISFKIMQEGMLIALAYSSEAFQQEPERIKDYYFQRLRWAKGNYQVVMANFKHLFDKSNWRVKLEVFYYSCTFFWFNAAIVLSDAFLISNLVALLIQLWRPETAITFDFYSSNIMITQLLLFNWLLMILLYVLQINTAMATQYGQATTEQIWLSLISYFTYSQLFIVISIHAIISVLLDTVFHRDGSKWIKTKRFMD